MLYICGCHRFIAVGLARTTHGFSADPLHRKWVELFRRCYNPKHKDYRYYGAKGVIVCAEWINDFLVFREWSLNNGYIKGLEIDRIDPDGNYEPSNCRYGNRELNTQNTGMRKDNKSGYRGVSKRISNGKVSWVAFININKKRHYLKSHDTPEKAAKAFNDFVIKHKSFHTLNVIP